MHWNLNIEAGTSHCIPKGVASARSMPRQSTCLFRGWGSSLVPGAIKLDNALLCRCLTSPLHLQPQQHTTPRCRTTFPTRRHRSLRARCALTPSLHQLAKLSSQYRPLARREQQFTESGALSRQIRHLSFACMADLECCIVSISLMSRTQKYLLTIIRLHSPHQSHPPRLRHPSNHV